MVVPVLPPTTVESATGPPTAADPTHGPLGPTDTVQGVAAYSSPISSDPAGTPPIAVGPREPPPDDGDRPVRPGPARTGEDTHADAGAGAVALPDGTPSIVDDLERTRPTAASTAPVRTDGVRARVDLGRTLDGERVSIPAGRCIHVVVVGTGALASAVYRAVAAQLPTLDGTTTVRATPSPDAAEASSVATTDRIVAEQSGTSADRACGGPSSPSPPSLPPLPPGTAVSVALGAAGTVRASAVLVPCDGQRPRRADVVLHVTRYGCTVRRSGESHRVAIDPVLPLLPGP